jgi:hypothetical protein
VRPIFPFGFRFRFSMRTLCAVTVLSAVLAMQLMGLVVALLAAASLGAGATIAIVAVFVRMLAE